MELRTPGASEKLSDKYPYPQQASEGFHISDRSDRSLSTVPDPSGSGRVDMLTSPIAAAQAAVATGAWVKSKHDMYLIRGSVGA